MENRDRRKSDVNSPGAECYLVAVYPRGKGCGLPAAVGWKRELALELATGAVGRTVAVSRAVH